MSSYLDSVFTPHFKGKGKWKDAPIHRVLLSMVRKRPRDLVKLCTLAAREAWDNRHDRILTSDLTAVFSNYSSDRLTDTINEYKSEIPHLRELLLKMRPTVSEQRNKEKLWVYSETDLQKKLKNILSYSDIKFSNHRQMTPRNLAVFLYKINFLTARKDTPEGIERVYYDENQYIHNEYAEFGYQFEIHMAYRWALQPSNQDDIMSTYD